MISIFYTSFNDQWENIYYQKALQLLPLPEQNRLTKYLRWQDRQAGILGRLLIQYALKTLRSDKTLSDLAYHSSGKPYIHSGPYLNVSHSGQLVVCAISSTHNIGVDIETITSINLNDFKSIFTEAEYLHVTNSNFLENTFFHLWTIKEAVLKADGIGISIPLSKIDSLTNPVLVNEKLWYVKELNLNSSYKCHLASEERSELSLYHLSPDDIIL